MLAGVSRPRARGTVATTLMNTFAPQLPPEVRLGLQRFVREGGGLAGNHGTSHASMDWPAFADMIGVRRGVHRASTGKCWIKIDDPKSRLTAPFNGEDFEYQDEFFRFPNPPYSRSRLHILMSIDVAKTDMNQGRVFVPGSTISRGLCGRLDSRL
jgi:type 1 glutamine amidotransferase